MAEVKKRELDMLHGSIWNKLPLFALPVAATAILEQLFNASDLAIVGNFSGEASTLAVAAVGANGSIIGLIVNLFIGIALGANVVIATAIGCGDEDSVRRAVHSSLVYEILSGYLRGFGISLVPAALTMLGVCGIRIAWVKLVFPQSRTFGTIMAVYPVSLGATALLIFLAALCYRPSKRFASLEREKDA